MIRDLPDKVTQESARASFVPQRVLSSSDMRIEEFVLSHLPSITIQAGGSLTSRMCAVEEEDGNTELHEAVLRRSVKDVKNILKETTTADLFNIDEETPLFLAVQELLPAVISDFAELEKVKELIFVLSKKGNFQPNPLTNSLEASQLIIKLLLDYGADPDAPNHEGMSSLDLCFTCVKTQATFPTTAFFSKLKEILDRSSPH